MATQRDEIPVQTNDRSAFRELTDAEERALLDHGARELMGISGEEFLRRWDAGEIDVDDPATHTRIVHLEGLVNSIRSSSPSDIVADQVPVDEDVRPEYMLTYAEGRKLLDRIARQELGIGGEEFLRRWDAGEIDPDDPDSHLQVMTVEAYIPFARRMTSQ